MTDESTVAERNCTGGARREGLRRACREEDAFGTDRRSGGGAREPKGGAPPASVPPPQGSARARPPARTEPHRVDTGDQREQHRAGDSGALPGGQHGHRGARHRREPKPRGRLANLAQRQRAVRRWGQAHAVRLARRASRVPTGIGMGAPSHCPSGAMPRLRGDGNAPTSGGNPSKHVPRAASRLWGCVPCSGSDEWPRDTRHLQRQNRLGLRRSSGGRQSAQLPSSLVGGALARSVRQP